MGDIERSVSSYGSVQVANLEKDVRGLLFSLQWLLL